MWKFGIAVVTALMVALPAAARDKVDHIACIGGDRAIDDIVRIVANEVVNEQQINNVDQLWDNNGLCHRQSVNRMFTTDPYIAAQRNIMGSVEVGGRILLLVPSRHPSRAGMVWIVIIDRIGYFPNQTVNGRNSSDQLAWKVSAIYNLNRYRLPRPCVSRLQKIPGAHMVYFHHGEYSRCADQFRY